MRRNLGVAVLAASALYSAVDLLGWLRPPMLRMRAHGGVERMIALTLASLSFKAIVLIAGALLTFWPDRDTVHRER